MARYDLLVQGLSDFARIDQVLAQRKVSRDPLSGVINGSNKVFHTNYAPVLTSGSLTVYVNNSTVTGMADYDTGEVTLDSAPPNQPQANYTFTPYNLTQRLQFLIGGFQTMEGMWPRGWTLVDALNAAADENSAQIYPDEGGSDPLTGKTVQVAYFVACCRYSYLLAQLTGSAIGDFSWRETVRGMAVDKSRRPTNLDKALEQAYKAAEVAMHSAQDKYYTSGEHVGGAIGSPMTLEYVYDLEWQQGALTDANSSQRGNRAFLPLTG